MIFVECVFVYDVLNGVRQSRRFICSPGLIVCYRLVRLSVSVSERQFFEPKLSLSHFPQIWSVVLLRVGAIKAKTKRCFDSVVPQLVSTGAQWSHPSPEA